MKLIPALDKEQELGKLPNKERDLCPMVHMPSIDGLSGIPQAR